MNSILLKELELISLSREEILELQRVSRDFIKSLKEKGLRAFVGGSLAKGTAVKKGGIQDVDIFVVFDYSEDILKLEGILRGMSLPGKLSKVHGSRDYFQIDCSAPKGVPPAQKASAGADKVGNIILEVVPVVKNKDPEMAENVTDVSLSHVKYVVGALKRASQVPSSRTNPSLADEIKLAKTFCYANRCYGAESYIKGFSGYSLEILVIHFGGFVKFLRGISKVRVVDPLKYFKGERDVLNEINASKLVGPVVVVDPTYKFRNVTAGLGYETFAKFNEIAKKFLKSPSLDFFEKKDIDTEGMKKIKGSFIEIDLKSDRQEGDIAGTKMKKLLDFFARELVRKGQGVLVKEFDYSGSGQKAKGYLVVEEKLEIEVRGPSVGLQDAVRAFLKSRGSRRSVVEGRSKAYKRKGFWWFKEGVSVNGVFESIRKVEKEMGASAKLVYD